MFSLEARQIFEFEDKAGDKPFKAAADPARILRRIKAATQGQFGRMVADMQSKDDEVKSAAIDAICKAVAFAFEIKPFDPVTKVGWLEVHLILLAAKFNAFIEELKKNTLSSPIASTATQVSPST